MISKGTLRIHLESDESNEPAELALAATSHVLNEEIIVLLFGTFDPLTIQPSADEGSPATAVAHPFARIAMPRSTFATWLIETIQMIGGLPEKDQFGWQKLVEIVQKGDVS